MNTNVVRELVSMNLMDEVELSDTIILFHNPESSDTYINMQSGVKSDTLSGAIRDGIRYILAPHCFLIHEAFGFIAKYVEKYDMLVTCFYELKYENHMFSWEEKLMVIIARDGAMAFHKPNNAFTDLRCIKRFLPAIDLCGQYAAPKETHISHTLLNEKFDLNITGKSGSEARLFAKGVLHFFSGTFVTFKNAKHIYELAVSSDKIGITSELGIKKHDMESIDAGSLSIPDDYDKLISKCAYRCLRNYITSAGVAYCNFITGVVFGYLQNCGGEYVLRKFKAFIKSEPFPDKEYRIPIEYIEYEQVHISAELLKNMNIVSVPLLYFDRDGIRDGIFKYAENELLYSKVQVKRALMTGLNPGQLFDNNDNISCALASAFLPLYEKLNHLLLSAKEQKDKDPVSIRNIKVMSDTLRNIATGCRSNLHARLLSFLGELHPEESELNRMLGIPKALMRMMTDGCFKSFDPIRRLKGIFSYCTDYFMGMDYNQLMNIFNVFSAYGAFSYDENPYSCCFAILLSVFGTQNITGYLNFLSKVEKMETDYAGCEGIQVYLNYLEKVAALSSSVKGLSWKFKNMEELLRADESILPAYMVLNDRENYEDALRCFKERQSTWEKYLYHDDKFMVVFPKSPSELVNEGVKLNHCAKTFIDAVAKGKTTILFIRKVSSPSRPFYTLEVNDDIIIQCHGYNNCLVGEYRGLWQFVEKFAAEKGLDTDAFDIDECFGAEEYD